MNEDNMFAMMIARHSVDTRRFMIILSTLLILTAIALSVSIWSVLLILSTGSGVLTDRSINLPQQICLPSDAQERLRLITERPKDYLACLERAMKS
jgi:hypothetical protein